MDSENHYVALSRAIFELRSGRPIMVDGLCFGAAELHPASITQGIHAETLHAEILDSLAVSQWNTPQNDNEKLALKLLKRAGLLPAACLQDADADSLNLSGEPLCHALQQEAHQLTRIAQAKLPLKACEDAHIISFRSPSGASEHLAILIGDPLAQKSPWVRVHSSCITGDLLGSLRCDCGDQLQLALRQMAEQGHGVLCYLEQEGRGIGISNKIRAYALQDTGMDTLDANHALGFEADERNFGLAATMLKELGITTLTLLSNNPEKAQKLSEAGLTVTRVETLKATPTAHNADYLDTKAKRFGHQL